MKHLPCGGIGLVYTEYIPKIAEVKKGLCSAPRREIPPLVEHFHPIF